MPKNDPPADRRAIERRRADRRGLGFTARREANADWNQHARARVLAYLKELPPEDLWRWLDGLWLGCATDAQLLALVEAVQEQEGLKREHPPHRGRPRVGLLGGHPIHDAAIRARWRRLTDELHTFSQYRKWHFSRMNRTPGGKVRSLEDREACLASPIGRYVDGLGLFGDLFEQQQIPSEMAARVLHREAEQKLTALEARHRRTAETTGRERTRASSLIAAVRAAKRRDALPTWQTLYDRLRKS